MTEKKYIYQAMFLLDNEEVRKGFNAAKDWIQSSLEKHGLEVKVLRLWGERQLAYPIGGRKRATYLLGWLEGSGDMVNEVRRELYLIGPAFRCLFLQEDAIPEEELVYGIQKMEDSELIIPEEFQEPDFEEPYEEPEEEQAAKDEPKEEKAEKPNSAEKTEEVKTDG
ncbi:MAG: 30S ribosomal protein S6 [Planctomycetota bacterium]|nr:30S ribosomal protein S6 [Planctomycetota bacterium]MDA1114075.1 30S ribosomal protein S6 [Planctomycetota bacterium]